METDSKNKKNTIYSIIKSVLAIVFPLITFPYSSRVLGVENYGKLNFASSFITYFALFASLGLATYAIRECAKVRENREDLGKLASKFFSINLCATIISYIAIIVFLLAFAFLRNYVLLISIYSFAIVFNTLGSDWLNTAVGDFKYITLRTLASNLLAIILMFVFVKNENDYVIYALISVTASSGASILNIFYRRKYCTIKFSFDMELKKHLPPILWMFAVLVVQEVFVSSDTTIIGLLIDDNAVGLYSVAVRIYRLPSALTNSITNVLLPSLAIAFSTNDIQKNKATQRYGINFLSLIGFPCCAGLIVFSKEIIQFISGADYVGASASLTVLGISYLVTLFGVVITNFNIIANGKDKLCFFACLASALINVVLNIWLIPMYGIFAAACTTVVSQIVVIVIEFPFLDKKIVDFSILKSTIKPLICTAFLIVWLLASKILFSNIYLLILFGVIFGGCIYFLLNILLKEEMTIDFLKGFVGFFRKNFRK